MRGRDVLFRLLFVRRMVRQLFWRPVGTDALSFGVRGMFGWTMN